MPQVGSRPLYVCVCAWSALSLSSAPPNALLCSLLTVSSLLERHRDAREQRRLRRGGRGRGRRRVARNVVACMRGRSPRGLSCGGQAANGGGEKRARQPRGAPRERFSKRRESAVAGSGLVLFLVHVHPRFLSRADLFLRVVLRR